MYQLTQANKHIQVNKQIYEPTNEYKHAFAMTQRQENTVSSFLVWHVEQYT